MNFWIFIKQWLSSIWANKLRSILSILWIVIWISSVVVMLAIWEWTKKQILSSFDNIDNLITIEKKYTWNEQKVAWGWKEATVDEYVSPVKDVINIETADQLKSNVFWILDIAYTVTTNLWDVNYNSKPIHWDVQWISKWYLQIKWYKIKDGSYFSNINYSNNDKVAILWHELVNEAFWKENPIWKVILMWWTPFIVQWILDKKSWVTDWTIFIPSSTAVNRLWSKDLQKIEVFADKRLSVNDVKKNLQFFLLKKSWTTIPSEVKFQVKTNEDALKQVNQIIGQMKLLLWAIGSIALIVWWIWIMNIMLVSVTERTREIWIKKAIWATKLNIMLQFLVESIILSLIWCIIAVWLCYFFVYLINKFWQASNFSASITSSVIIMASSVSILMWIIFGLMPAWKAARLKPIDALRYE